MEVVFALALLMTTAGMLILAVRLSRQVAATESEDPVTSEAIRQAFAAQQPKTPPSKFGLIEAAMAKGGEFYNNNGDPMKTPAIAIHWLKIEGELEMCIGGVIITTLYIDDSPAPEEEEECLACG